MLTFYLKKRYYFKLYNDKLNFFYFSLNKNLILKKVFI